MTKLRKKSLTVLDQVQCKKYYHQFQVTFNHLRWVMKLLLNHFEPLAFKQRRNVEHLKLDDASILALIWLQIEWQITSQTHFYRIVRTILPHLKLVERSRFNRRCRALCPVLRAIRCGLIRHSEWSDLAIIDSFPVPLCQNIRNHRAKIFRGDADIGYNATKHLWFYGFKVHVVMEADGLILNYVVTAASVHDVREAPELICHCPCPEIIADVGYVSRSLAQTLLQAGYQIWTPYRSNMAGAKEHNSRHLKKIRRRIESCFSSLTDLKVEENTTRTRSGFQTRLEMIILNYNLHHTRFITN